MDTTWDCIVVGGGAAGLSAALVLGRARQRTLVVDAGRQSNLPALGIGGLLGHDGQAPADFYAAGRAELAAYPSVELRTGTVTDGTRDGDDFVLTLADGARATARRVLLATGMDYRYADVPGLTERWGRSVFHCPFCHGWEVRDGALGVLDPDPATGVMRALLLRVWSDDVTLLTNGRAALADEDRARLADAGVGVDERAVAAVTGPDDASLDRVRFADGGERAVDGLLVAVTLHQRSDLAAQLGAATGESKGPATDPIDVDAMLATDVPGLWAAGDVGGAMPSVANAVAAGGMAAAMLVHAAALRAPDPVSA